MKPLWALIGIAAVAACLQAFAWVPANDAEALPPVSWQQCYSSFEEHVVTIAGDDAKDCGFFSTQATEVEKTEVKLCLMKIVDTDESFRIGHRSSGDDSWFCDVAIRDDKGAYWSFFYNSDISGGSGGPSTIWVGECKGIKLEPGTIGRDSFFSLVECEAREDIEAKLLAE